MLIELLLDNLFGIFQLLTTPINIPKFPLSVQVYINSAMEYLEAGAGILANYVNLHFFLIVFGIILAVDIGINLYHFVMWILRKIPFISIE